VVYIIFMQIIIDFKKQDKKEINKNEDKVNTCIDLLNDVKTKL